MLQLISKQDSHNDDLDSSTAAEPGDEGRNLTLAQEDALRRRR